MQSQSWLVASHQHIKYFFSKLVAVSCNKLDLKPAGYWTVAKDIGTILESVVRICLNKHVFYILIFLSRWAYELIVIGLFVFFCIFLYREIWARFLAFESNIGDLASILKVEKRRFTAFKEEYEGKETALLVDRYKFMDLYPCSASELKALGYKVS